MSGSSVESFGGGITLARSPPRQVCHDDRSFEVRAIDPAGNVDPTPAQRTWFALGLLLF